MHAYACMAMSFACCYLESVWTVYANTLVRPTVCHVQDPAGLHVHDKFVKKLKQAELQMIAANDATNPASRARSSPSGVAYRLMYPSTVTEPVTPDNKGMTGRGIP
jgi:hypothetical protein